jgi:hypothetical protein
MKVKKKRYSLKDTEALEKAHLELIDRIDKGLHWPFDRVDPDVLNYKIKTKLDDLEEAPW